MNIHRLLAGTLAFVLVAGMASPAMAGVATGFSGTYDPSNWNFSTDGDGTVDETNAPDSIQLTGSDGGCLLNGDVFLSASASRALNQPADHIAISGCANYYEITIQCAGTVFFDWDYETFDDGPSFDPMGFLVNNDITQLTDSGGTDIQSGSESVPVQGGDVFGFWIDSTDDSAGESTTVYSEFSGPLCTVGGEFLPIDSTALLLAGLQTSAIWMLPILAGAAGVGVFYIKTRMNKE